MMDKNNDARSTITGIIRVIGIGQSLRGDDAAGLEAVRLWQTIYHATHGHAEVQVELAELPGIDLLRLLEGAQAAILVDAVRSSSKPGTVHILPENEIAAFSAGSGSAHGWGVAEALTLGRQLMPDCMPQMLVLIGIEAGRCARPCLRRPG
jgi:hydrogenase maturation protease